ncbi:MAG: type II toxin-antitoxin system RelE/ParE family toxin [Methylococcales bacterium]
MTYRLKFLASAKKEWDKLDKKLKQCLENPHIPANKLRDFDSAYKIKLRASGYRLVYEVDDQEIVVFVIAVGKRENSVVYDKAKERSKP